MNYRTIAATRSAEFLKAVWRSPLLREAVKTILIVVAIVFGVRTLLFQPFRIPSGSMENTLLVGDYIIVSKYAYGYSNYSIQIPYMSSPDLFSGRVLGSGPDRGDVVVFAYPKDPAVSYIKRVVGLPGDRIRMSGGILYINDVPAKQQRIDDYIEKLENGMEHPVPRYRETLEGGREHEVLDRFANSSYDDTDEFTVPADHYFMMGDNRDNSNDSRVPGSGVGFVPAANIIGRAEFILSSWTCSDDWQCATRLAEVWTWPWTLRTDRILHSIQ
jgi:signal peptidase I